MSDDWPAIEGTPKQISWAESIRDELVDSLVRHMDAKGVEDRWRTLVLERLTAVTAAGRWIGMRATAPDRLLFQFLDPADLAPGGAASSEWVGGRPVNEDDAAAFEAAAKDRLVELEGIISKCRARVAAEAALSGPPEVRVGRWSAALAVIERSEARLQPWPAGRRCGRDRFDGERCRATAVRMIEAPACWNHLTATERACRDLVEGASLRVEPEVFRLRWTDRGMLVPLEQRTPQPQPAPTTRQPAPDDLDDTAAHARSAEVRAVIDRLRADVAALIAEARGGSLRQRQRCRDIAADLYRKAVAEIEPWPSRQCARRRTDGQPCRGTAVRMFKDPCCPSHLTDAERLCRDVAEDLWNVRSESRDFGLRTTRTVDQYGWLRFSEVAFDDPEPPAHADGSPPRLHVVPRAAEGGVA